MYLEKNSIDLLKKALETLEKGFSSLPASTAHHDSEKMERVLMELAEKMTDNYPYFHPLYCGQMLKPPHPVARTAYMLSMWINPNNHALDGGRASSHLEKEAVARIAAMFGWENHLGHLCGGGTMANLEALWVCGKETPGKRIAASEMSHYTHSRISEVLRIPYTPVPVNPQGQMDITALETILESGEIGAVVATMGTTGTGSIDPLPEILELQKKYGFRIHADAAYGGYFTLLDNLDTPAREAYTALSRVDSIVVDPHKHGLQPYGCGCVLFRDPAVGKYYKHDSPYTYFSSTDLHLGEISLECSRPGASAAALWATQELLPMEKGGEFASDLAQCRDAALDLADRIEGDPRFRLLMKPETDIVTWAPLAAKSSDISRLTRSFFETAASKDLHLAAFSFPSSLLKEAWTDVEFDTENVLCLRCCLMKPEHREWLNRIWELLSGTAREVCG